LAHGESNLSSPPKFASTKLKIFSASAKGKGSSAMSGEPVFFKSLERSSSSAAAAFQAGSGPPTVVFAGIGV